MHKNLSFLAMAAAVCAGCGGIFGGSGGGLHGLLFYRFTTANAPVLHRLDSRGGGFINVRGTLDGFEGSMDQTFNVYTSFADGNVYRVTNGVATQLTSSGDDFRPCVTPDGTRIAFVSDRDGNLEVYTMDSAGGGQTNVSVDAGSDTFAAISMDGTKVVFSSNRDGNGEVYIVDFDGSNLTRLTNDAGDDSTPAFSPDGTHIIFSSNRTGTYQIYSMDLAGNNVTQLTTNPGDKLHPSFNVNGSAIFFYTAGAVRQIWRCNPDGTHQLQLTNDSIHDSDKMSTWVY